MHINDFCRLHDEKKLKGVFVSGTASVIGKVKSVKYHDKNYSFEYPDDCFIDQLKSKLVDIQLGKIDSDFTEIIELD